MAVIVIPARYASTRFPKKMLAKLGDKPLIVHTVLSALKSKANSVTVVTDHEEIRSALFGICEVVMSSPDIATGTDRVAFAAGKIPDDVIVNVQGDEPFIPPALLNELIYVMDNGNDDAASVCTKFNDSSAALSASAVKVALSLSSYALYFSRSPIPYDRDGVCPIYYRHIGVYAYRRDFLNKFAALPKTPLEKAEMLEQLRVLEHGYKIRMIKTDYTPISVDTPEDLLQAEKFLNNS